MCTLKFNVNGECLTVLYLTVYYKKKKKNVRMNKCKSLDSFLRRSLTLKRTRGVSMLVFKDLFDFKNEMLIKTKFNAIK